MNSKRYFCHLKFQWLLGALCQELETKTKYILLYLWYDKMLLFFFFQIVFDFKKFFKLYFRFAYITTRLQY